jgi:dimethylargininase
VSAPDTPAHAGPVAITRAVSPSFAACELTYQARVPIDVARAAAEHAAYEDALRALGASVVRAAPAPELPDAVFVEDTAVVLDEIAILARPGAPVRRAEVASVSEVLGRYRPLATMASPATLDGGDVLRAGRALFVGISSRTGREAVEQLARLLRPWDYRVVGVAVTECLHLKSAVTEVADGLLLANPRWVRAADFAPLEVLPVSEEEPGAANALKLGGAVVFPEHYPLTARRLTEAGIRVLPVPNREIAKAEGGVTCCSLIVEGRGPA